MESKKPSQAFTALGRPWMIPTNQPRKLLDRSSKTGARMSKVCVKAGLTASKVAMVRTARRSRTGM